MKGKRKCGEERIKERGMEGKETQKYFSIGSEGKTKSHHLHFGGPGRDEKRLGILSYRSIASLLHNLCTPNHSSESTSTPKKSKSH